MSFEWKTPDGSPVPAGGPPLPDLVGGSTSDALELLLWYAEGDPSATAETDLLVLAYAERKAAGADVWVRVGERPQDEQWLEARVVGQVTGNAGGVVETPFVSDWTAVGAYRALVIPRAWPDVAHRIELRWRVPFLSEDYALRMRLGLLYRSRSQPVFGPVISPGVRLGVGDLASTGLQRGGAFTPTDPPGPTFFVEQRLVRLKGRAAGFGAVAVDPGDVDGDGATLAEGELYHLALSQTAAGLQLVRGRKGFDPAPPAAADGVYLGRVRVQKDGGAVVIDAEDFDRSDVGYVGHPVTPVDGPALEVGGGEAVGRTTRRTHAGTDRIDLDPDAVSYLFQTPDGHYVASPDEVPTDLGPDLLGPLAEAETDGASVIRFRDRRPFAEPLIHLQAEGSSVGDLGEWTLSADLELVSARLTVPTAAADLGAVDGETTVQLEAETAPGVWTALFGTTTPPTLAFDQVDDHGLAVPDLVHLRRGQKIRARLTSLPSISGFGPVRLEVRGATLEGGPIAGAPSAGPGGAPDPIPSHVTVDQPGHGLAAWTCIRHDGAAWVPTAAADVAAPYALAIATDGDAVTLQSSGVVTASHPYPVGPVYEGDDGLLTSTAPAVGRVLQVGVALDPGRVLLTWTLERSA